MRTEKVNENFASVTGNAQSSKFEIAEESQGFIIEALSKNIYKDPVGTIIREYCSNAWDANVEAKSENPILVNLDSDATGQFFSVTDFGPGLTEERINKVFVKYGKSTKGGDNSGIGGFGIGAKSAFSYADAFFVTTVAEGKTTKYLVSKTTKNPEMIKLSSEETPDLANGTEIKIYIKNTWDFNEFDEKIRRQLLHFREVDFKINQEEVPEFVDKKFFENERVEITTSSDTQFKNLYALIGPVAYPIDFKILGLTPIEMPIGLKFDIGELDVTLSREELRYTDVTKEKLREKIKAFTEMVQSNYDDRRWWVKDPMDFYKNAENDKSVVLGDFSFPICKSLRIKYNHYKIMGVHKDFSISAKKIPFIKTVAVFNGTDVKRGQNDIPENLFKTVFDSDYYDVVLQDERTISTNKLRYLDSLNGEKKVLVVKKEKIEYSTYKAMAGLPRFTAPNIKDSNFFSRIKGLKKKVEYPMLKSLKKLSDVNVPKEFLDSIKGDSKTVSAKGVRISDITRTFGNGYRKLRLEGEKIWNGSFDFKYLKDVRIVYSDSTEDIQKMLECSFLNLNKEVLRVNKDYYGRKDPIYKTTYFLKTDRKKDFDLLENLEYATHVDEFIKGMKPDSGMKGGIVYRKLQNLISGRHYDLLRNLKAIPELQKHEVMKADRWKYNGESTRVARYEELTGNKVLDDSPVQWTFITKAINRIIGNFEMIEVLKHDFYRDRYESKEKIIMDKIYREKGLLPSFEAYSPLAEWEVQLLAEGKAKTEYLQSL